MNERLTGYKIKSFLRQKGFNTKQMSVKELQGGYDWHFLVTLKDKSLDREAVRRAVLPLENIDIDPHSGEILGGGNVWIRVEYDWRLA